MAFHAPISPDDRPEPAGKDKSSGGLQSLVQAERLMQIAILLPCAMLLGWGAGWWIDQHFHTHWATIAGLIFGLVSGMVSVIRMALDAGNAKPGRGSK